MHPTAVAPIIPAPADPAEWPAWRESLYRWREDAMRMLAYRDQFYTDSTFRWTTGCFACGFAMLCDETFYDPHAGCYTTAAFLDQGISAFGGYDAIVLWHAYPNIGFDDRNQFDFYRDMPGGLAGLRSVVDDCHARQVKVFIAYNPWDTGTRREARADQDMLAELVAVLDADGIFLDTMRHGGPELRAALDAARPGVALESENDLPIEFIHNHHLSWAQWFMDSDVPGVLRNKWLEQRHLQHQIWRWNTDHSAELQSAWINGSGMLIWENVFGTWVGWNERDKSLLRMMLPVQRYFAELLSTGEWMPLVPTLQADSFASSWHADHATLWALVNRSQEGRHGAQLEVEPRAGWRYFDLVTGREVQPRMNNGRATLTGSLPGRGIGGFVALPEGALHPEFSALLAGQAQAAARLSDDVTFPGRPLRAQAVAPTLRYPAAAIPSGMQRAAGGVIRQTTEHRNRECGFLSFPFIGHHWPLPHFHEIVSETHVVELEPFAVDGAEVTNRQYALFLEATGYQPRQTTNFLKHWTEGAPPAGGEDDPVVYVDLDDARAYAEWAGKRLPTAAEWQQAIESGAAGYGRRRVWNWTESVHSDGRTRFCLIKGGADYQAEGSDWYADGGPRSPEFAAKFLLMWPGLDRCATIGFRCVVDLAATPE